MDELKTIRIILVVALGAILWTNYKDDGLSKGSSAGKLDSIPSSSYTPPPKEVEPKPIITDDPFLGPPTKTLPLPKECPKDCKECPRQSDAPKSKQLDELLDLLRKGAGGLKSTPIIGDDTPVPPKPEPKAEPKVPAVVQPPMPETTSEPDIPKIFLQAPAPQEPTGGPTYYNPITGKNHPFPSTQPETDFQPIQTRSCPTGGCPTGG